MTSGGQNTRIEVTAIEESTVEAIKVLKNDVMASLTLDSVCCSSHWRVSSLRLAGRSQPTGAHVQSGSPWSSHIPLACEPGLRRSH